MPFRVVDNNIAPMDISIRCFGEYSYRVTNPMLFYTNVCGNVEGDYTREQIDSQLKSELLTALQPAFAKISEMGVRYSALPGTPRRSPRRSTTCFLKNGRTCAAWKSCPLASIRQAQETRR